MKSKPQLVLDIGGVLATNLTSFWEKFALESHTEYDHLRAHYKQEVSENLWTGNITEDYFWQWLTTHYPSVKKERAKELLQLAFKPLPSILFIPLWSQQADLHIISNHRAEWAKRLLLPYTSHLKSMTISSEAGLMKPQLEMFKKVDKLINKKKPILFVDDDEKNLKKAACLGWHTIGADENGLWTDEVNFYLKNVQEESHGFSR